jgi:hypothetical protein
MMRSIIVNFSFHCFRGTPLALAFAASTIALTACNGTVGQGVADGFSGSSTVPSIEFAPGRSDK